MERILPREPVPDLDAYRGAGGGEGLARVREIGGSAVIDEVKKSGLRGRGGAGFPTGVKWRGTASEDLPKTVVCNAAEGEPGTVKDRYLIDYDPYRVIEGVAIASLAIGAETAYIGIKTRFADQVQRLRSAAVEMDAAGMVDDVEIRLVEGPDDYLFGVETGMLEVIEGRDPLPRLVPPYVQGLTTPAGVETATVVNNVETLANIPGIVTHGADWFREAGTESSPGTMVFTVSGDVRTPGVAELPLGTPLSFLLYGVGEGLEAGRRPKLVISGVSNRPLTASEIDTPLSYEAMDAIGSGLGSGGFIVYDDTTCVVEVGTVLSGFLQVGSCGQCPPCKLGTTAFTEKFGRVMAKTASDDDIDDMLGWIPRVTDANRCGLGVGQRNLAAGILDTFAADVVACVEGRCPGHRGLAPPLPTDHDPINRRPVVRFLS